MFTRIDFSKLTLMDALDLAHLIEVEAYQRYMLFAAQLGRRDVGDIAPSTVVFGVVMATRLKPGLGSKLPVNRILEGD